MSIFSAIPDFGTNSKHLNTFFSLNIKKSLHNTLITMNLFIPVMNTAHIPHTYALLKKMLPTILMSKCFNEENLPFSQEVKKTEIGHLFEHILLEYLCELKLAKGYSEAVYAGRTNWNWKVDPYGTFHIIIDAGSEDTDILPEALERSINLLKIILQENSYSGYDNSYEQSMMYQYAFEDRE